MPQDAGSFRGLRPGELPDAVQRVPVARDPRMQERCRLSGGQRMPEMTGPPQEVGRSF